MPKKMIRNYGEDVYELVSSITELKFKSQIRGSGIVFKKIFEMSDLILGKRSYLILTNSDSIWFTDRDEFIEEFIQFIKKRIEELNVDYKELLHRQQQAIIDENWNHLEEERIGYLGDKQLKLLNRMRSLRKVIPDIND